MEDLLHKHRPKVGELFRVKDPEGLVVMTLQDNKHFSSRRLEKDTILLLTSFTKEAFEVSFSIDYQSPGSWSCSFLHEGKYVLKIFENTDREYSFYSSLELIH